MPVDYDSKDASNAVPAGDYDGELVKVEDSTSKTSGNPMQVWTFKVFAEGRTTLVKDYVVIPAATFKIKQLAIALNRKSDFEAKQFQADDYIGAGVVLELTVEQKDGFDEQNKIKKVKAAQSDSQVAPPPAPKTIGQKLQARQAEKVPAGPAFDPETGEIDDIPF